MEELETRPPAAEEEISAAWPPGGQDTDLGELTELPGHLARRFKQNSDSIFASELGAANITPEQYSVLHGLHIHPGLDQVGLSGLVALDASTTGNVVRRLERRKLLDRKPRPTDKRSKMLYLTDAGEGVLGEVQSAVANVQERILAPLTARERERFLALLHKLLAVNTRARARRTPPRA